MLFIGWACFDDTEVFVVSSDRVFVIGLDGVRCFMMIRVIGSESLLVSDGVDVWYSRVVGEGSVWLVYCVVFGV